MKKFIATALLASTSLILAGQVNAASTSKTASSDFKVKLEVLSTCAINATDIDFGSVNSDVAPNDKTGTLNVTCTNQTPYRVGLSGSGKMTHETDSSSTIAYQLFQNSGDKEQWDNNNQYTGIGSGDVQAISVFAKVSGSSNVRAGKYSDTVTATVTY
ncbi:Csu type fimbrial protein [Acinetobacter baumannii]|uniref:Csu type fimbrial protein n=1 Tax=Acinetobacter baumannii TaxID=470 RepID=UPI000D6989D0|nr:spore coat U domain-containing protein [Acinetobacter baumannii]